MFNNRALQICLVMWVVFWLIATEARREYMFDVVDSMALAIGLCVIASFIPGVRAAFKDHDRMNRAQFLVIGIILTWISLLSRMFWVWMWRTAGEPIGGLDASPFAFLAFIGVTGGVLHMISPGVVEGEVPRSGWNLLLFSIFLALIIFLAKESAQIYLGLPGLRD
jgi:hypothetical protein